MNIIREFHHAADKHGVRWIMNRAPHYVMKRVRKYTDQALKSKFSGHPKYAKYQFQYLQNSAPEDIRSYEVPIDPFHVMYVDPQRITHKSCRRWRPFEFRKKLFGKVKSGGWDQSRIRLQNKRVYRGFVQRFELGLNWNETALRGLPADQLKEYDGLYRDIRESGYKSQEKLRNDLNAPHTYSDISLERYYWELAQPSQQRSDTAKSLRRLLDEVLVDIGRNGELLYVDGKHRLCIAQILNLDWIPVVVAYRHRSWMEHLQNAWKRNVSSDWHPDFRQFSV